MAPMMNGNARKAALILLCSISFACRPPSRIKPAEAIRQSSEAEGSRSADAGATRDPFWRGGLAAEYRTVWAAFGRQDGRAAIAALERARAKDPNYAITLWTLASIYARTGEGDRAMTLLDALVGRNLGIDPVAEPALAALRDRSDFQQMAGRFSGEVEPKNRAVVAFTINDLELIPEGIAFDATSRRFFVSSIFKRKIVQVDEHGVARDFTTSRQDGLYQVLGMKVDAQRRLLWAVSYAPETDGEDAGAAAVHKYDVDSGKLIQRYALGGRPQGHLLNDLALDAAGNAFVTDSTAGAIWIVRRGTDALEQFLPNNTFFYPNGVALTPDGKRLLVASWGPGLSIVDLESKAITGVRQPANIVPVGVDGMVLHGGQLIAIQNDFARARVTRFALDAACEEIVGAEILEQNHAEFDTPTTGVIADGSFYFIGNAQLGKLSPEGKLAPPEQLTPVKIMKLAL